jgi:glycosyltransferase involved in cell wall biosynthesis
VSVSPFASGVSKTTFVLPVWGGYAGAPLAEALGSLHDQEADARIIVVDNASEPPLRDLPGAEIIRSSERVTLGGARNLGLAAVDTEYVIVWDADDVMLPGTLSFLEPAIEREPGFVAVGCAMIEMPSYVRHRWPRVWVGRLVRHQRLFALLDCVWSVYPTTGSTIMRTDCVRAAGGYSETHSGADWVLGVSLAFRGRLGWSERPGRLYRQHAASVSAQRTGLRPLFSHAAAVRGRIRADRGIPTWGRALLPLIHALQALAIAAHGVIASTRRLRGGSATLADGPGPPPGASGGVRTPTATEEEGDRGDQTQRQQDR